jgi:hypothetical protein
VSCVSFSFRGSVSDKYFLLDHDLFRHVTRDVKHSNIVENFQGVLKNHVFQILRVELYRQGL